MERDASRTLHTLANESLWKPGDNKKYAKELFFFLQNFCSFKCQTYKFFHTRIYGFQATLHISGNIYRMKAYLLLILQLSSNIQWNSNTIQWFQTNDVHLITIYV